MKTKRLLCVVISVLASTYAGFAVSESDGRPGRAAAIPVRITGYIAPKPPECEKTPPHELPAHVIEEHLCDQRNAMRIRAGEWDSIGPGDQQFLEFRLLAGPAPASVVALPLISTETRVAGLWANRLQVDVPEGIDPNALQLVPGQKLMIYFD